MQQNCPKMIYILSTYQSQQQSRAR